MTRNQEMRILIKNIKSIVQVREKPVLKICGQEMSQLNCLSNSWLLIDKGIISDYGSMEHLPAIEENSVKLINASGKMVFPCWCDSHTHLVFASSREEEFVDRIKGLSYEEIAKKGGGILNSAKRLQEASEEELYEQAFRRLEEIKMMGTGALEIKSGYGLTVEDEIKMLRIIKRLKGSSPLTIKATFLGAHAIPLEYKNKRAAYINLIINEMLPRVAKEELAEYCDVFCDRGFFTPEETDIILKAGLKYGLQPKIHANELDFSGGIQVGVRNNALSVDHLEFTGEEEIKILLESSTMPTLLPSTAFFLGLRYPPARKMIEAGLPVALASDYNPGSSPSGRMSFILSLACIQMKMTPEEAINAATINGAYAMGLSKDYGSIAKGKKANIFLTKKIPSYAFLPYSFGNDLTDMVIIDGKLQ